ncbi:MAG: glycosyltransferase family 4 protein [Thermales bacterium]|nr:glycosyltransferase family 4 protein [Thermales bacterium]
MKFLGRTSDEEYIELLRKAEGFLFPGKEDFGITPIEVLASGTPIIAYKSGGALEYIVDQKTVYF